MKSEEQERKELRAKLVKHLLLIIIFSIIVGLIGHTWGTAIYSFIQSNKWLLLLFVTGSILYISWAEPVLFRDYKQSLRRTWYFVLIIGILILLKESGFEINSWQRYIYLTGMFIFVDLALFLTPTIKKFGGAEMETVEEIESINKQMQKEIKKIQSKSAVYTSILSRLQREQLLKKAWTDIEEYRSDLESFLNYYGEACMQEIIVFYDSVEETLPVQISTVLGIELNQEQSSKLENEQIVEIDTQQVLIPFSHQLHSVVIAVISQREPITQIDFDHIIDLSVIHTWQKKI
jgi:hypothetical protein